MSTGTVIVPPRRKPVNYVIVATLIRPMTVIVAVTHTYDNRSRLHINVA